VKLFIRRTLLRYVGMERPSVVRLWRSRARLRQLNFLPIFLHYLGLHVIA